MQLAIELPNDYMALESEQIVQQEMKLSYALRLYKHAKVTISRAAQLSGMDIYQFMAACKQEEIPVIDVSKDELETELKGMEVL